MNTSKQPQQGQQQMVFVIIWGALFMAQLVFLLVASVQHPFVPASLMTDMSKNPASLVFVLMGVVNYVIAYVLPSVIVRKQIQQLRAQNQGLTSQHLMRLCFPPFIMRCAFIEAATLFGFVLAMNIGNTAALVLMLVPSLILFAFNFPSPRYLENFVNG